MATIVNLGNQIISSVRSAPAKSVVFNQLLHKLVPAGIYEGGLLERESDGMGGFLNNRVIVKRFVALVNDSTYGPGPTEFPSGIGIKEEDSIFRHYINGISVRVQTQIDQTLGVGTVNNRIGDSTNGHTGSIVHPLNPFIVGRYKWTEDNDENFLEFLFCDFEFIEANPDLIIFGRAVFNDEELSANFDYTLRTVPPQIDIEARRDNLKVIPAADEGEPNRVRVLPGSFIYNNRYYEYEGGLSPQIPTTVSPPLPRIDIVVITVDDPLDIRITSGTPHANPQAPAYPIDGIVVAEIRREAFRENVSGADILEILRADGFGLNNLPWDSIPGSINASIIPTGQELSGGAINGPQYSLPTSTTVPNALQFILNRVINLDGYVKDENGNVILRGEYFVHKDIPKPDISIPSGFDPTLDLIISPMLGGTVYIRGNVSTLGDTIFESGIVTNGDSEINASLSVSNDLSVGNDFTTLNAEITGDLQGNTASFSGAVTGQSFTGTSSRDKKNVLGDFEESALSLISKLQIKNFTFKDDEKQLNRVGFIAEDSPLQFTEDNKHIDMLSTIGILLKAIQELQDEIIHLKQGDIR